MNKSTSHIVGLLLAVAAGAYGLYLAGARGEWVWGVISLYLIALGLSNYHARMQRDSLASANIENDADA